jgi:hypothetical protein
MVRRMLHNAGHTVVHLRRVSFGEIGLDGAVGLGGGVADEAEGDGNDSVNSGSDSDDDEEEVRVTGATGATGATGVVSMQQKEAAAAAVQEGVLPMGAVRLCSEQEARWAARLMRAALRREEALKAAAKQAGEAGGANAEAAGSSSSSSNSSSSSRGSSTSKRERGAAGKNAVTGKIGTGVSESLRESRGEVENAKSFKLTSMLTDLTKGKLRNPIKPSGDASGSTIVGEANGANGAKGTNMKHTWRIA